jgi:hypothetical protein
MLTKAINAILVNGFNHLLYVADKPMQCINLLKKEISTIAVLFKKARLRSYPINNISGKELFLSME